MNDSNNSFLSRSYCTRLILPINVYVYPILNSTGILLNTFSAITFLAIIKNKTMIKNQGFMFHYLFIRSINDGCLFLASMFSVIYFCENECALSKSYIAQLWYIWIFFYFTCVTELYSTILEILATFDRLLIIHQYFKKFKFYKTKLFFILVNVISLAYCLTFYIHRLFELRIESSILSNQTNSRIYRTVYTEFYFTNLDINMRFMHSLVRDLVGISLILVANILIFINIRKALLTKEKMVHNKEHRGNIEHREKEVSIMVLMTGTVFIVGHTPIFFYYLPVNLFQNNQECFFEIFRLVLLLSYWVGFFFYYYSNLIFRKNFHAILFKCLKKSPSVNNSTLDHTPPLH